MADSDLYIGLISGTSVDGIDCALVQFDKDQPTLVDSFFVPTESSLRERILRLCEGQGIDLQLYGEADIEIGRAFATAVKKLLAQANVDAANITAIGSHGQTVWHQPTGHSPFTLQLGDPNSIAQATGITTVADFRRRDMAAGGEGAPLAPLLHRNVFHSQEYDRAVVNIGGISNVTVLPKSGACLAFDTGPGNVLMDYWIGKHQQCRFDDNGQWAVQGTANPALLKSLLDEAYFSKTAPKSTGRELFNSHWLEDKLCNFGESISAVDVQATLLSFTVNSIAADIIRLFSPQQVFVCGGGASNAALMKALAETMNNCSVESTSALGLDPDWVEAIAFAWMAKQTIEGKEIDTTAFTGASSPIILGGIYQS
jgi:anhydro-N-acetylmuramic acid kinase